jgi:hypothetical protein
MGEYKVERQEKQERINYGMRANFSREVEGKEKDVTLLK